VQTGLFTFWFWFEGFCCVVLFVYSFRVVLWIIVINTSWHAVVSENSLHSLCILSKFFFFFGVRSNFNKLKTPDHERWLAICVISISTVIVSHASVLVQVQSSIHAANSRLSAYADNSMICYVCKGHVKLCTCIKIRSDYPHGGRVASVRRHWPHGD